MADTNNPMPVNNQAEVQMAVDQALKDQKKAKKKKRLIILGVIVAVIVVIAIVGGGSGDKVTPADGEGSTKSSSSENVKTSYKVGEAVQINNVKISFTDCNDNFTDYDEYNEPKEGMKYVRAAFTFENTGDKDEVLDGFDCYADDTAYEANYFMDDDKSPTLESISKGKKFNAVVYYEVPKDAKSIILQYETSYWSSDYVDFVIK